MRAVCCYCCVFLWGTVWHSGLLMYQMTLLCDGCPFTLLDDNLPDESCFFEPQWLTPLKHTWLWAPQRHIVHWLSYLWLLSLCHSSPALLLFKSLGSIDLGSSSRAGKLQLCLLHNHNFWCLICHMLLISQSACWFGFALYILQWEHLKHI